MQLNMKKKKSNKKLGRRPRQINLQKKKNTDGQEAHEKMLNITNYQTNANQNYQTSPHTGQKGHDQTVYK